MADEEVVESVVRVGSVFWVVWLVGSLMLLSSARSVRGGAGRHRCASARSIFRITFDVGQATSSHERKLMGMGMRIGRTGGMRSLSVTRRRDE